MYLWRRYFVNSNICVLMWKKRNSDFATRACIQIALAARVPQRPFNTRGNMRKSDFDMKFVSRIELES